MADRLLISDHSADENDENLNIQQSLPKETNKWDIFGYFKKKKDGYGNLSGDDKESPYFVSEGTLINPEKKDKKAKETLVAEQCLDSTVNKEIGRKLLTLSISPFLCIGTIIACFQCTGKTPVTIEVLIIHVI